MSVFYKKVDGNEGNKCHYPTRLDTYGCGCQHDCKYCYAKSLLLFRKFWHPEAPAVSDIDSIRRLVKTLPKDEIVRLGGMTDCFMPLEAEKHITYETIKALKEAKVAQAQTAGAPPKYYKCVCEKCGHIMFVREGDICDRMEE